jgi:hypothetical protein
LFNGNSGRFSVAAVPNEVRNMDILPVQQRISEVLNFWIPLKIAFTRHFLYRSGTGLTNSASSRRLARRETANQGFGTSFHFTLRLPPERSKFRRCGGVTWIVNLLRAN